MNVLGMRMNVSWEMSDKCEFWRCSSSVQSRNGSFLTQVCTVQEVVSRPWKPFLEGVTWCREYARVTISFKWGTLTIQRGMCQFNGWVQFLVRFRLPSPVLYIEPAFWTWIDNMGNSIFYSKKITIPCISHWIVFWRFFPSPFSPILPHRHSLGFSIPLFLIYSTLP